MRIAINGFGNVGQALANVLHKKAESLTARYQFEPRVVALTTRSRGSVYIPGGIDLETVLNTVSTTGALHDVPRPDDAPSTWRLTDLILSGSVDVLVDLTPTDLITGQPALDLFRTALDAGVHVVTANKGPIALAFTELRGKSRASGAHLLYEGTVMAGTPALRLPQIGLAGATISKARGILNGTTNYILTQMENGMEYADALAQAQELGYAETDPSGDVDGWDVASKVMILSASVFKQPITLDDVDVTGISGITADDIATASADGERWKLIGEITPEGAKVYPTRLPLSDPLANISGATNAITYETDLLGPVTLVGAGAGGEATAFALLSDLLAIHRGYNG